MRKAVDRYSRDANVAIITLSIHRAAMRKSLLLVTGILLISFGVFTPLTTMVVTFLVPETFASTARIAVQVAATSDIAIEAAKIQSRNILEQVAINLDLGKEWGRKYKQPNALSPERTYAILKGSVVVRQQRNTALIEIQVFSDNRAEAAMIANNIAAVYRNSVSGSSNPGTKLAVQIIEDAEPNSKPVRPNISLNITLGLLLGAAFALLGILLLRVARKAQPNAPASR